MRPASQCFFIHSCIYLRILIISYLATFLGTNSLYVMICRKAVNQSIVTIWTSYCLSKNCVANVTFFEVGIFLSSMLINHGRMDAEFLGLSSSRVCLPNADMCLCSMMLCFVPSYSFLLKQPTGDLFITKQLLKYSERTERQLIGRILMYTKTTLFFRK